MNWHSLLGLDTEQRKLVFVAGCPWSCSAKRHWSDTPSAANSKENRRVHCRRKRNIPCFVWMVSTFSPTPKTEKFHPRRNQTFSLVGKRLVLFDAYIDGWKPRDEDPECHVQSVHKMWVHEMNGWFSRMLLSGQRTMCEFQQKMSRFPNGRQNHGIAGQRSSCEYFASETKSPLVLLVVDATMASRKWRLTEGRTPALATKMFALYLIAWWQRTQQSPSFRCPPLSSPSGCLFLYQRSPLAFGLWPRG